MSENDWHAFRISAGYSNMVQPEIKVFPETPMESAKSLDTVREVPEDHAQQDGPLSDVLDS